MIQPLEEVTPICDTVQVHVFVSTGVIAKVFGAKIRISSKSICKGQQYASMSVEMKSGHIFDL